MSTTYTGTSTYSIADITAVMKNVTTDIIMIAASTGAITEDTARLWGHDIELLAQYGFLKAIDLTLFSNGIEEKATRYDVLDSTGDFVMARPGGMLWPRVANPRLRILLFHTLAYRDLGPQAMETLRKELKISWGNSNESHSHESLTASTGREYVQNSYGVQRKDYKK